MRTAFLISRRIGWKSAFVALALAANVALPVAGLHADERSDANAAAPSTAPAGKTIRGRVVLETDGQPAAKAEVRLVTWTNNNTRYDTRTVTTNEQGEFVFDGVVEGNHRLAAFFGDSSSRKSRYKGEGVDLKSDEPITLKLAKMPSLAVRVVAKADAKPIADALVRLVWSDTDRDRRTGADGKASYRGLTPEVWHVEVHAKGFAEVERPVNLAGTDAADVTIELEPGGALFGTVTDDARAPIAGAGFSVFPENFSGGQLEYMKTDAAGRYRFDYLPASQGLELSLSHDNFLDLREQVTLSSGAGHERQLDLVMKRRPHGGTVSGLVSDAEGNAIAGATVANHGRSSRQVRTATTDDLGIFLLDDVYESSIGHELVVKAKRFAPQRVKFRPGTRDEPAKLAITLEDGHRIRGRVVDASGNPIREAAVYFADGNRGAGMEFGGKGTTDADGRFAFDSLPADCPFNFIADGFSELVDARLPLDDDEEVVVTMQSEGVIRGRVVDAASGKPVTPFNVQITFSPDREPNEPGHSLSGARATSPEGEQFASPEGAFVLKELIRRMPLQVSVTANGYERRVLRRVVAEADADAQIVEFRLDPLDRTQFFAIRGRVIDAEKQPLADIKLMLISAAELPAHHNPLLPSFVEYPFGWPMIRSDNVAKADGVKQVLSTVSRPDGIFSFEDVQPAAAIQIAYWGDGITQGRLADIAEMSADERANIEIETVAPGTVRGTLDRQALPDVSAVTLSPAGFSIDRDFHHAYLTANDDKFEIRNVPPGEYELQVYGERIRNQQTDGFTHEVLHRQTVDVESGETITIEIAAEPAE